MRHTHRFLRMYLPHRLLRQRPASRVLPYVRARPTRLCQRRLTLSMSPLPSGGAFWNSAIRPSVCLSVCPMYRPLQQRAAGLLLWARSGRRYRSIAARPALGRNCVTLSAEHRLVISGNSVPHFRAYLFSNCPQGSSQGS